MSRDSPEDLCRRVRELEATVRGLTNELVDTIERLRELETRLAETRPNGSHPQEPNSPSPTEDHDDDETGTEDDIIVA